MRRALLYIGLFLAGLTVLALAGLGFLMWVYPRAGPARDIDVEPSPEKVERGRYLAEHVTQCIVCHADRDFDRYAGPVVEGTEGRGGQRWDAARGGVPGEVYATNITPAGVGAWTDGELYRAIFVGVGRDDRPLHPVMPYPHYQALCNEDRMAIIAYVRTLEPVEHEVPDGHVRFPMSVILRMIPHAASPPPCPTADDDAVKRGEYLANVAACGACHTPRPNGAPDLDRMFAGGQAFELPGGTARASNITRDPQTGIGEWTEEEFVERFARHRGQPAAAVAPGEPNTVMPWTAYAGLTDEDLRDIFAFLDTLETRYTEVETWSPH